VWDEEDNAGEEHSVVYIGDMLDLENAVFLSGPAGHLAPKKKPAGRPPRKMSHAILHISMQFVWILTAG